MERTAAVIICGTRTFDDKKLLYAKMDFLVSKLGKPHVLVGAGRHLAWKSGKKVDVGADYYGEQWAYSRYLTVVRFHPEGRPPGCFHQRNREMVAAAKENYRKAYCVAFWDGESAGTASVIELCRKAKIPVRVLNIRG